MSPFRRHLFARCVGDLPRPAAQPFPAAKAGISSRQARHSFSAAKRRFCTHFFDVCQRNGYPQRKHSKGGCTPLQTPALRAPMYVMDKAPKPLPCVLREVRIIASQSYSQPCMSVERRSMSVQCTHCVRQGVSRGNAPLDALFFGKIIFPKMQSSVAVAFLRGDAAQ